MIENRTEIAHKLKDIRQELGLTQEQLAKEIGSHRSAVRRWEKATVAISPEKIAAIDALCEKRNSIHRLNIRIPDSGRIKKEEMGGTIKKLKAIRAALGLTQRDLGKELGVTRNKVGWWEQGKQGVSVRMVEVINLFCLQNGLDIRV